MERGGGGALSRHVIVCSRVLQPVGRIKMQSRSKTITPSIQPRVLVLSKWIQMLPKFPGINLPSKSENCRTLEMVNVQLKIP